MRRAAWLAGFLFLVGCKPAADDRRAGGWVTVFSVQGELSIRMPASDRPVIWTAQPVGALTQYDHEAKDAAGVYRISWLRYPSAPPARQLDLVRNDLVSSIGAAVLEDRTLQVGGFPARHLVLDRTERGERVIGHVRLVLAGDRLIVLVYAPASGAADASARDAFFDSLQVSPPPPAEAALVP